MRDYGVNEYGMVLNTNHLHILASKNCSNYSEGEWCVSKANRYEYIEEIAERLGIDCITSFDGDALYIDDNGSDDWGNYESYSDDVIYFIPLSKYPNLFKLPKFRKETGLI